MGSNPTRSSTAWWQSGDAADCNSVYAGSIPAHASKNLSWAGLVGEAPDCDSGAARFEPSAQYQSFLGEAERRSLSLRQGKVTKSR